MKIGFIGHENPGIRRDLGGGLAVTVQEGEVACLGIGGGGDARHRQIAVAFHYRIGQFRYLAERQSP